jgi:hypothetical protein
MKRGRKPRGFNTHKVGKEMHDIGKQKIQNLGPSLADLPRPICFDILLRLPTSRLPKEYKLRRVFMSFSFLHL